jgi:predicted RND superfamily exporter protein
MRDKLFNFLSRIHVEHPWRVLIIVGIITVIAMGLASQLKMSMLMSDTLPENDKRTLEYDKVLKEFRTATNIIVVAQGAEDRIKKFADELAPQLTELKDPETGEKYIQRVDYKVNAEFIKRHGLMLIKEDQLKDVKDMFKNPNLVSLIGNINDSMEKEYVGQEESLSTRAKEDEAFFFLDSIENYLGVIKRYATGERKSRKEAKEAVDRLLFGEPYLLSYDKDTLIINAVPTFSMLDVRLMVGSVDAVQAEVDELLKKYPDVKAGLGGSMALGRDEMEYTEKSLAYTSLIALVLILVLLIVSFRMLAAPVLALLNLIVGLIWALGAAFILLGKLNMYTQMMGVILIGLGIDFSIHLIAVFTEYRSLGNSIADSVKGAFDKTGRGILTGAFTTSAVFFTLMISRTRGMSHMGLATGVGLLTVLCSTFFMLPSLLVLRERRIEKRRAKGKIKKEFVKKDISFKFLGNLTNLFSKRYVVTIIFCIIATALFIYNALNIKFDHNYMNMEPEGLESIELMDKIVDEFDLSMDYALILAGSLEESRELVEKAKEKSSVARVEDISAYLPVKEDQIKRKPYIEEVKKTILASRIQRTFGDGDYWKLKEELKRLEMNLMEIQDMAFIGGQDKVDNKCSRIVGNPDKPETKNRIAQLVELMDKNRSKAMTGLAGFQDVTAPYFRESVFSMCNTSPIELEDLPEDILDRYANKDRNLFMVTIYPNGNLWEEKGLLYKFSGQMWEVSDRATGMAPIMVAMIDIFGKDGRNAVILAVIVIFIILMIDYGKVTHVLLAMVPLIAGMFWMVGIMKVSGLMITIMNIMALPLIVGIGIDDGVHLLHRWRIEGKGQIPRIYASTGRAILLTSLTTMLAFGSLMFSLYRGFASLGIAMFIGVGACFLTSVFVLAGVLGLIERK